MLKFIHAADFHLDSAFAALPPEKAAERRREQRELPGRLAEAVRTWGAELVLLSGDLFDAKPYPETVEAVKAALAEMAVPVFLAPGNHDPYGPPYTGDVAGERPHLPDMPGWRASPCRSWGSRSTGRPSRPTPRRKGCSGASPRRRMARSTSASSTGSWGRHRSTTPSPGRISPPAALPTWPWATSISGRSRCAIGRTTAAWPGCPEGRGFDELGEKGFYSGTIDEDGKIGLDFVPFARRRYEILTVDVTGQDAGPPLKAALPAGTARDLYRILLTGRPERAGVDEEACKKRLAGRSSMPWSSGTRPRLAEDLWAAGGGGFPPGPVSPADSEDPAGDCAGDGGGAGRRIHHGGPVRPGGPGPPGSQLSAFPEGEGHHQSEDRPERILLIGTGGTIASDVTEERPGAGADHGAAFEPYSRHLGASAVWTACSC